MKCKARVPLFMLVLALNIPCFAQGMGSIVGTVTDPAGAVLPSAKITVIELGTGVSRTTVADSQGYFVVPSLKPSQYEVSVEANGFRTAKQTVTLQADQSLTLNARLELGAPTETVEVTSTQLQVDTTTSTLKQVVYQ